MPIHAILALSLAVTGSFAGVALFLSRSWSELGVNMCHHGVLWRPGHTMKDSSIPTEVVRFCLCQIRSRVLLQF